MRHVPWWTLIEGSRLTLSNWRQPNRRTALGSDSLLLHLLLRQRCRCCRADGGNSEAVLLTGSELSGSRSRRLPCRRPLHRARRR